MIYPTNINRIRRFLEDLPYKYEALREGCGTVSARNKSVRDIIEEARKLKDLIIHQGPLCSEEVEGEAGRQAEALSWPWRPLLKGEKVEPRS